MKRVIVIPARGGSKGIPRKNLQRLNGIPLIASAISCASGANVDRVIVSTDDPEIRAVALEAGADVPFLRPAEFAQDAVSLIEVLQHALAVLDRQGERVDAVGSLQPTAPFLTTRSVNECLAAFENAAADSVVTVRRIVHNHPYRAYRRSPGGQLQALMPEGERALQRQDLPELFAFSGGFYMRRSGLLRAWSGRDFALGARCVGVEVSEIESLNIDSPLDLALARCLSADAAAEERR